MNQHVIGVIFELWAATVASIVLFGVIHSLLQGKGEFTMEYKGHMPVPGDVKKELTKKHEAERLAEIKK